jgi:NADH:ubiquinone oxidoreductase subunit K
MIGLNHYLILSAVLFSLGLYGALSKRNAIAVLMSIEILFNAVNLALVALARYTVPQAPGAAGALLTGQVFALFIITVAAAEVALGLAIVIALYRNRETVDISRINLLRR